MATRTRRRPPVARAVPGRHRGGPSPAEQDATVRRGQQRRQQAGQRARSAVIAPVGIGAKAGRGGQHALMAEFLLFLAIVAMRAVADYVPQDEGASKGKITPSSGQLGPLPVLAGGFATFFILSFLAARGGTWAKVAAAFGLVIDVTLLMRSTAELETVSKSFGNVTSSSSSAAAEPSTYVEPVGYEGIATIPEG